MNTYVGKLRLIVEPKSTIKSNNDEGQETELIADDKNDILQKMFSKRPTMVKII